MLFVLMSLVGALPLTAVTAGPLSFAFVGKNTPPRGDYGLHRDCVLSEPSFNRSRTQAAAAAYVT